MVVPEAAEFGTERDVAQAAAGDRDAFARLVLQHRETLWRVAMSCLGHPQDAEDAISEAVLKALQSVGRLRNHAYFKTWLVRILINECKDALKRRSRHSAYAAPKQAVEEKGFDGVDAFSAVMSLPQDMRAVAVLFYYEDMACEEIAKLLCLNPATVRTRLSRARNQLRETLRLEETQ